MSDTRLHRSERGLAHALAVRARGLALPPEGLPPDVIMDSWARCLELGLQPGSAVKVPVVESGELALRRERAEVVRRLAQAELETLSRQIAGSNYLLAFADAEGVILDLYADNRFSVMADDSSIVVGSRWTEQTAGTNGLGTALAMGSSVAVTGLEHYFLTLGGISCTAAPVRDASGQIVGVLDASSHYESRQRHTQALVQMAATHIENGLLIHQMRSHLVLALHPRAEYLETLSAALLAFDERGRLLAINSPGGSVLMGLDVHLGMRFEELFREPLEHVLARLHRNRDVTLRDRLGSVLVARCLSQPPAPAVPTVGHTRARSAAVEPASPPPATRQPTQTPQTTYGAQTTPARFVASDPAVAQACRLVDAAVRLQVPLLFQGETGTGKEVMARHAHERSGRAGPFIAVNCAAVPDDLFEAELFGYVGGSFTGARREGNPGLIAAADGGTLLLDEVRELPLPLQAALLRFLDDHEVRAVGGQSTRRVDVQIMAATHADLDDEVRHKRFREDLLYRLNTVKVLLPPLRERADFAELVHQVLNSLDVRASLTPAALQSLARHRWPGNIRELRTVLTRALLACSLSGARRTLDSGDIESLLPAPPAARPAEPAPAETSRLRRHIAELVRAEFERNGGCVSQTSRALGISRTTVYRHLRS